MEFSPLRRLAIRLAYLTPEDRRWILERLDSGERDALDTLLQEIAALGLDRDPAVLGALREEAPERFTADSLVPDDVALQQQVTRLQDPYWAALLLQQHEPAQRRRAMMLLPEGDVIRRKESGLSGSAVPVALLAALSRYAALQPGDADVGS